MNLRVDSSCSQPAFLTAGGQAPIRLRTSFPSSLTGYPPAERRNETGREDGSSRKRDWERIISGQLCGAVF